MINSRWKKIILVVSIAAVAFGVRLWDLGSQELVGDEGAYAFRSALYLDYLGTNFQTQPIEWYADTELPSWTKLSFHDHPPLGFLIRHWFFNFFGTTPFIARLPGVVLGVCSVLLVYGILRRNPIASHASESQALWGALLAAASGAMIWSSRMVLLESFAIFFILAGLYACIRFFENPRWWWVFGSALGFMFLTKYTTIVLLPALLIYALIFHRQIFRDFRIYAALAVALMLFSPVVAYNVNLYQARGHFDLQFSYLLHEETPEWTGLIGKADAPFGEIGPRMLDLYGIGELMLAIAGILFSLVFLRRMNRKGVVFSTLYALSCFTLFIAVGSADRFIVLLAPAVLAFGSVLLGAVFEWGKRGVKQYIAPALFLIIVFAGSIRYVSNTENNGVVALDRYLSGELRGISSIAVPSTENPHLNKIIEKNALRNTSGTPAKVLLIYSDTLALPSRLWLFDRRLLAEGIPVFYVESFSKAVEENPELFEGFQAYFVQSTEYGFLNPFKKENEVGNAFEQALASEGIEPVHVIYGRG